MVDVVVQTYASSEHVLEGDLGFGLVLFWVGFWGPFWGRFWAAYGWTDRRHRLQARPVPGRFRRAWLEPSLLVTLQGTAPPAGGNRIASRSP